MLTGKKEKTVDNKLEGFPPELLEMKLYKIREYL